jgi:hypothetical protein
MCCYFSISYEKIFEFLLDRLADTFGYSQQKHKNMKYFIDTEFREQPCTIDLISIGIVAEDGSEYYALNKECNLKKVWKDDWLRTNVLLPIYIDKVHGDMRNYATFSYSTVKGIFKGFGKTKAELAFEIQNFVSDKPEFYGYYADYDWVVFCWIFGRMIDLPNGFPMYCKDLKQIMDENGLDEAWKEANCPENAHQHNALWDARWTRDLYFAIKKVVN